MYLLKRPDQLNCFPAQPQTPTLTGPSEVVSGTTETWTCVSKGGNPPPTLSMRIGNTIFNNELSVSSVLDQSTNSYTVTGTLQWAPNGQHNQQILHCDVSHPETLGNTPQTVDLPLTVKCKLILKPSTIDTTATLALPIPRFIELFSYTNEVTKRLYI